MGARGWDESILGCMCLCGHQSLGELDGKECRGALKALHCLVQLMESKGHSQAGVR